MASADARILEQPWPWSTQSTIAVGLHVGTAFVESTVDLLVNTFEIERGIVLAHVGETDLITVNLERLLHVSLA